MPSGFGLLDAILNRLGRGVVAGTAAGSSQSLTQETGFGVVSAVGSGSSETVGAAVGIHIPGLPRRAHRFLTVR